MSGGGGQLVMLNRLLILGNESLQLGTASFLQTVLESFHFIKVALDHYLKKKNFKNI